MDVNQTHLKSLLAQIDFAFADYQQHPESEDYAQAYEETKSAFDHYIIPF